MQELPASLGMLTSLQRLVLSSNALSSFPGGIVAALTSLKILNLDHNQLQVLPAELCQLARLEKLYASHNNLQELPSMLDQLPKLQVLVVSHNQLTQLPEGLPGVLEECNVANNAITVIPAGLGRLQQLKIFNLDNNRVSTVPAELLLGCAALHTLSLHGNPITPDALQSNPAFDAFEK
ncbi:hypothetical protein QJQ45_026788 [Haematococcus lacustris]|nr:hypothetical protein QJQ45_026788 [Haematococcus lacustris]